jgi:tRNA(fMet)-specific endonuclease VapC
MRQVDFDCLCAHRAGEINAVLLNRGTPVSVTDVFIAATALEIGVPVITNNLRDFGRIDGLELVDWRG